MLYLCRNETMRRKVTVVRIRWHGTVDMIVQRLLTSSHTQCITMNEDAGANSPDAYPYQREDYASMKYVCHRKACANHEECKC